MLWNFAKKIVDRLSLKAVSQRFDKRRLQHEIDTHRLFLLLSYYRVANSGQNLNELITKDISKAAQNNRHEDREREVQSHLLDQVKNISSTLHSALLHAEDSSCAAATIEQEENEKRQENNSAHQQILLRKSGGFAAAHGTAARTRQANSRQLKNGENGTILSQKRVKELLKERLGFALDLRPSLQGGAASGTGLWLEGKAPLGAAVALYPGCIYPPLAYRRIPGYPRIDQGNDYLMARFDGAVLDAKPWGRGAESQPQGKGACKTARQHTQHSAEAGVRPQTHWHQYLETRHPLALAHFANHPSEGEQPNVMAAAFDFRLGEGEAPGLRAYMPNVLIGIDHDSPQIVSASETVPGLALIALRPLDDEELLLNYRLSTHVSRPSWYTPVDPEEDKRRWA